MELAEVGSLPRGRRLEAEDLTVWQWNGCFWQGDSAGTVSRYGGLCLLRDVAGQGRGLAGKGLEWPPKALQREPEVSGKGLSWDSSVSA